MTNINYLNYTTYLKYLKTFEQALVIASQLARSKGKDDEALNLLSLSNSLYEIGSKIEKIYNIEKPLFEPNKAKNEIKELHIKVLKVKTEFEEIMKEIF